MARKRMTDSLMQEALRLRAENLTLREVAARLDISVAMVSWHINKLRAAGTDVPRRHLKTGYDKLKSDSACGSVNAGRLSMKEVFSGMSQAEYEVFLRDHVRRGETVGGAVVRIIKEKANGLG